MFRTESEFVNWLQTQTPQNSRAVKLGIGHDASVVKLAAGRELVLKSDMSIENVHFSMKLHPPDSVGHRALARPLSDFAAVGGSPKFALISLALSQGTSRSWVDRFYSGVFALAAQHGVTLVGGDTARTPGPVHIDVMIAGEVSPGRALGRSGARPGDQIYVSGCLGLSALGLQLLRKKLAMRIRGRVLASDLATRLRPRSPNGISASALGKHLYPEPRCDLGRFLSEHRLASAAIDISDGLSTDLNHLCESSGVGACVWRELLPVPELTGLRRAKSRTRDGYAMSRTEAWAALPGAQRRPPELKLALDGGEDYELLFTVPGRKASAVPRTIRGVTPHRIGEICSSKNVMLILADGRRSRLHPRGYDHFRQRQ